MALWRYVLEMPDGSKEENVLAAGNKRAAEERAARFAERREARVVDGPEAVDPVRGSM